MHPALSVILFTTFSGAGYGLLIAIGFGNTVGWVPPDRVLGISVIVTALALITFGLLSSTFHLGHPERAWRALTQWRSSWLSREGVVALLVYPPALMMLWQFIANEQSTANTSSGLLTAILAFATVYCTAMIYASLKSIHAWHNAWVPAVYLSLALCSGLVLLHGITTVVGSKPVQIGTLIVVISAVSFYIKLSYWKFIDATTSTSTVQNALGLPNGGHVTMTQAPHTQANYLQQEMGFRIARRHATKLRRIAMVGIFVLPPLCCTIPAQGTAGIALAGLSCASLILGLCIERWLFFAEAKHTVGLYYGAQDA